MGRIGRHDNAFACLQQIRLAGYFDLRFPIQHLDEGIERGGVLAEFLALVKGKQGDITAFGFGDLAGDNRTGLVFSQGSQIRISDLGVVDMGSSNSDGDLGESSPLRINGWRIDREPVRV